jgi:hypothetical protein
MNPKEKTFIGILAAVTAVCAGGLYYFAGKGSTRFDTAKEQYDALGAEITQMENLPLFPTSQNKKNKEDAVAAYEKDALALAKKLQALRPQAMPVSDPQKFTNDLVKTAADTLAAYGEAGLKVDGAKGTIPQAFYLGFENYKNTPAQQEATSILTYQLGAISELHAHLAAAKPAELLNFLRVELPEEKGGTYTAVAGQPFRTLPVEIFFAGPESSLRAFLNALQTSKSHYYLIRTLRIRNEKLTGPKASDVRFESETAKPAGGTEGGSIFDSFDNLPTPDAAPAPEGAAPAPEGAAPAPAPSKDDSIILKQVLGNENINVFLRIDILLFDAAPQPN